MKYLRQFCIIIGISFLGEILHHLIPYPIPASIYGIVLLFIFLMTGIIKPQQIEGTAGFLIEIMPILFIPSVVSIIGLWDILKNRWLQYLAVLVLTTFIVMAVSGTITQHLLKGERSKNE